MSVKNITKYNYKPVKSLKAHAVRRTHNSLLKRITRFLTQEHAQVVAVHPVQYLYNTKTSLVQKQSVILPRRAGVLLASAIAIGLAASLPMDRSIASASLDSLQQFFKQDELTEQMSRLHLRTLQASLHKVQEASEPALPIDIPTPTVAIEIAPVPQATPENTAKSTLTTAPPSVTLPVKYQPSQETAKVSKSQPKPSQIPTFSVPGAQNQLFMSIERGDNLSSLFKQHALSLTDLHRILKLGAEVNALKSLSIGQKVFVQADGSGHILTLQLELPDEQTLHIGFSKETRNFVVTTHDKPLGKALVVRTHLLNLKFSKAGSFAQNLEKQEVNADLIEQLGELFRELVDIEQQKLNAGTQLHVLFEGYFYQDEVVKINHILAAELKTKQKAYQVVRYTDVEGRTNYYTPQGRNLTSSTTQTPVKDPRITSGFTYARRHPMLGTVRPHLGIDYGAASGAPIYATADGVVSYKNWRSGYGRTLQLKHEKKYETLYAHMSQYADNLKVGSRVKQGQVIGYVGSSGLATSSHLHYEVLLDGEHRNPLTTKLPQTTYVAETQQADFKEKSRLLLGQLSASGQQVAQNQTPLALLP